MNINQMPFFVTGMEAAFTPKTQTQTAPESEPIKFESVLREKHNESTGQAEQKDALGSENKPEEGASAPEQEIREEQYVLAAAMMMQPRPKIVSVLPDQTTVEQLTPVEIVPEAAVEQTPSLEVLPEAAQEIGAQETEAAFTLTDEKAAVKAAVPMSQEMTEPEAIVEQPQETEVAETFQPVQARDSSEKPQTQEEPDVKLEARPETQAAQRPEEELEEDFEVKGAWSEPVFGETEAVPVKVAAPEQPVDLEAPDAVEQLSRSLADAAKKGLEQLQIHLTPEGLGELNVTISRLEGGALSVVLRAADPRAAALLQQHTADLQQTMASAVRDEVHITVQEPQNSQQQMLNPDAEQGRGQREQQRQRQDDQKQENDDFMQKLRLGLTDLTRAV